MTWKEWTSPKYSTDHSALQDRSPTRLFKVNVSPVDSSGTAGPAPSSGFHRGSGKQRVLLLRLSIRNLQRTVQDLQAFVSVIVSGGATVRLSSLPWIVARPNHTRLPARFLHLDRCQRAKDARRNLQKLASTSTRTTRAPPNRRTPGRCTSSDRNS